MSIPSGTDFDLIPVVAWFALSDATQVVVLEIGQISMDTVVVPRFLNARHELDFPIAGSQFNRFPENFIEGFAVFVEITDFSCHFDPCRKRKPNRRLTG